MKQPGRIAIWIFGMIILAVVILQAGRYSFVQDNGSSNFGPSGTSAFLELMKQSGYSVKVDNTSNPVIANTLIIPVSTHNRENFSKFMAKLKGNVKVIALTIPTDYDAKNARMSAINSATQKPVGELEPVSLKESAWEKPVLSDAQSTDLLTQKETSTTIVQISTKKDIQMVDVLDASCVTNHNIDKANNASIMMGLVKMVAKPGEPVTLVDTFAAQEVNSSLLARLGPPFEAAWNQLLLLVLVIFVTLSIRFGLSPAVRAQQRGGRELVDGLATMTRRKKNARWALRAVFDRALAELERRHRISREQIIQRPDFYMSYDDAMKLKAVEAATLDDISEQEAIRQAKELKRLV